MYYTDPLKLVSPPSVRPVTLMQPLTDLNVCEGDIAQLEVRFSQENVEGTWLKNGQVISASDRVHIIIDKQVHKLLLENVSREDAASYSFVVPAQDISTSGKLSVQSKREIGVMLISDHHCRPSLMFVSSVSSQPSKS